MTNLFGLDRTALKEFFERCGAPGFHGDQLFRWLYERRRFSPEEWTDLPLPLRQRLASETAVDPGRLAGRTEATDATIKFRNELSGGGVVESVYMVQGQRTTLCVSSQVGCALGCDFCLTARMDFVRHLTPGEIVGQVALIQNDRELDETPFNIVFMGMGEPLHNYDGVLGAFRLLTAPTGFGISRKRITVSTAGIAPAIERLAAEPGRPRLAVSLNATSDAVRDRIMPINRKYPIERLLAACRKFVEETGERFSFEYVLLDGVNDSVGDVRRLTTLARSVGAKVNLIPFNAVPEWLKYRPTHRDRVNQIRDELLAGGVTVSVRWSRGVEARAACGQLALLPES